MAKKILLKLADILGFHRSTKYVKEYIHKANIRSGLFMAAVVAVLEVWLVIRQHQKYIIPQTQGGMNYFESLFNNTSLFWLLMVMGISMFAYCLFYLSEKNHKAMVGVVLGASLIGLVLCCFLPNENRIKNFNPNRLVDTVMLILLYASIAIFHISVIIASLFKYKGKPKEWLNSVLIITLFATVLLIFGIKVSYGDFTSTTKDASGALIANPDYKEIICFLMNNVWTTGTVEIRAHNGTCHAGHAKFACLLALLIAAKAKTAKCASTKKPREHEEAARVQRGERCLRHAGVPAAPPGNRAGVQKLPQVPPRQPAGEQGVEARQAERMTELRGAGQPASPLSMACSKSKRFFEIKRKKFG